MLVRLVTVMNPVHAVLRNWDILPFIIHFVKGDFSRESGRIEEPNVKDLVAVALACHALSNLALNVLWRDIDLENICFLFPRDMIGATAHPSGRKLLTRIPATSQEWERFDVYAPRIRDLSASPSPNDPFLHGVRTRYPTLHPPFPNLTCLQWETTPSVVMDAMTLICPTLTEVLLSIDEDPMKDESNDALADVLRSLGETCSRLRNFGYTHSWTPNKHSKGVESSLIYLIRHCRRLETVRLPVSRELLRALGSLPGLSTLQLEDVRWEDRLQLSLPTEADEWIEEAERFPVLDDLIIQGPHTASSLTKCFQDSGCFPRVEFTMCEISESNQWSTPAIAEFFRGILRPDRREGLLDIWIDRASKVENPMVHDPWQSLQCLYSIPNLHTLSLGGFFFDINDEDLEEMSRIWPELQTLSLVVPCIEYCPSQISFQGLAHLSNLKHLTNVTLMLAPDSTISESMLSPSTSSNSQLKYLAIQGKFPPVTARVAAMFLILHFPRLKRIEISIDSDKGEEERIKEIQVLLDAARPKMQNLRSELRNSRSRTEVEQEGGMS